MVHRPGVAIARITPADKEALLFDDVLWLERAQEEHDQFTDILRSRGVEVLYFEDLLSDILVTPPSQSGSTWSRPMITPARVGREVAESLHALLRDAPVERVSDVMIGGILRSELDAWGIDDPFGNLGVERSPYELHPLPNLLFMRDNAAWVGSGLINSVNGYQGPLLRAVPGAGHLRPSSPFRRPRSHRLVRRWNGRGAAGNASRGVTCSSSPRRPSPSACPSGPDRRRSRCSPTTSSPDLRSATSWWSTWGRGGP